MDEFKQIVVDAGVKMCQRSLTVGTWGNISYRDPESGNIFLTPSGMDYQKLGTNDIVVYNAKGEIIEGKRKPSIEWSMHLAIFAAREDVNAIIHTHPTYSTAFAITDTSIPPVSEDFVQIVGDSVECAEYALPGTKELGEYAIKALASKNAVLLTSHGTLCVGPNMDFAFKVCDVVEKTAYLYLMSKNLGEARMIPPADIKAMQDFVKTKYGQ
ncbi:MAG: class II aldolase/adducin family protein [Firmicutes bacterium]|nr:class II aldolase/adducin family protein [Bacillota bacterium]